jgi:hypothetical protein
MAEYLDEGALTRLSGRMYAQSEASENISEVSSAPREEAEDVDGKGKEVKSHPKSRTQVLQAMRTVRGYCAMKPAEKDGEDGKKALAHNRAVQMMVHGYGDKDVHLVRAIATCNPKLAGAREMATEHVKESEDRKFLGGGVWALRRHGGTIVVKDPVHPIGDGNKITKPGARTKKGAHNGTRTHVGMTKRLDLRIRTGSTSHQAALVIGDISLINTRRKKSHELGQKKGPAIGFEPTWV